MATADTAADNLPILDHLVIDVRDRMDEAARVFAGLGFQLTPRGYHTLGSMNHLMMFATDYLELLSFGEGGANRPELLPFPIGLNGLVFKTADADATYGQAIAAGLPILPVQAFSRPVMLGGRTQDARFRTTRLDPSKIAMGRVYFCEHRIPELVWRPEWQDHPNGALAINRVVVATPEPQRSAELFRRLFGHAAVKTTDNGCILPMQSGSVVLCTQEAVIAEFGAAAADPAGRKEYLAALEVTVGSLSETTRQLGAVPGLRQEAQRVVVPAAAAFNTTLMFSEAR